MITCPYCRTENEPGAVRCRHCTSWMAQPPIQREWYRAREGKMIAGVCRGLADRFAIPLALVARPLHPLHLRGGLGDHPLRRALDRDAAAAAAHAVAPPVVHGPLVTPPPPAATSTQ